MARSKKQTVDYFPHFAKAGKTLFILESKWNNDGYAFFFKLLETLCESDGHFIDFSDTTTREYFLAKTHLDIQTATEMLNKLADLNKIDPELWSENVIWYQNLVDNLTDVYKKRNTDKPVKPEKNVISGTRNPAEVVFSEQKPPQNGQSANRNRQSKVKESKGEDTNVSKSEKKEISITHPLQIFVRDNFPTVSKLKNQLTEKECGKLTADYSKTEIKEILEQMENYKPLLTKSQSVNLTIRNWINRERKRNASNKPAYKPNSNGNSTYAKRIELTLDDLERSERENFIVGSN